MKLKKKWTDWSFAQSAEAVEYTDYFSAEGSDPPNECPVYDTKQSDVEVPVMLVLWVLRSTSLLSLLPGPLWSGVVIPDKVPVYGSNRTKLWFREFTDFEFKLRKYAKLILLEIKLFNHQNCVHILNWIIWNKTAFKLNSVYCPVGWGCRIHRLPHYRE